MVSVAESTGSPAAPAKSDSSYSAGCQDIASAPKDDCETILASTTGKAWVMASWDEDEQRWITFNRYWEEGMARHRPGWWFDPKFWMPLPPAPAGEN